MTEMQIQTLEALQKCVTPEKAAKSLGVSVRRVHQFCAEKRFDAVKIGRAWYIDPITLKEFASKERQSGNPNFGKTG